MVQFGYMGSAYMERMFGLQRPRVGLLNIGEEEGKGNDLAQEVYEKLKKTPLNFVGNVEGKDITAGAVDVVVTDGFTGNVAGEGERGAAGVRLRPRATRRREQDSVPAGGPRPPRRPARDATPPGVRRVRRRAAARA